MTALLLEALRRLVAGPRSHHDGSAPCQTPEQLRAAGWIRIAASGQIGRTPVARQITHGGEPRTVLLWRTRSHQPVAMDARCPHKPYSMVGARLVGDALECPIHRRRFAPNGRCLNRQDGAPAQPLPIREEAGHLWVLLAYPVSEPVA
jgi:phenylpropionate dioxygenase-like ring-hydroxylating dioxygenase large terminal subunit